MLFGLFLNRRDTQDRQAQGLDNGSQNLGDENPGDGHTSQGSGCCDRWRIPSDAERTLRPSTTPPGGCPRYKQAPVQAAGQTSRPLLTAILGTGAADLGARGACLINRSRQAD